MTVLADGGAVVDTGLVINIFIALGTIGVATVALWLRIQALRASAAQAREARLKLTRQVMCVYNPPRPRVGTSIEVVNASPEVITQLMVLVKAQVSGQDSASQPVWEWDDKALAAFPMISYLLPGARAVLPGAFWPQSDPDRDGPAAPRFSVTVEPLYVELEQMWQDSYGDVWNRRGTQEAIPTSWAAPWRDLRDYVPRYLQPGHRPPKAPVRQSPPLRVRVTGRLQRLKYQLQQHRRRHQQP